MKAVLFWKGCHLFKNGQDGFWIQCPSSEIEEKILPHLSGEYRTQFLKWRNERFLSTEWATINPGLLVEPDSYYFIISKDGKEVQPTDPFFPYSSQWYGGCPLEEIDIISIDSINDLNTIPNQRKDQNGASRAVRYESKGKPRKCPSCSSHRVARILYGMPIFSTKLEKDLSAGRIILGGCCITDDDPEWQCVDCKMMIHKKGLVPM